MKHYIPVMPERPAFMKIVDFEQQEITKGYILVLDKGVKESSIIILKKGGSESMFKTEVKALEGFENIFDELQAKKTSLEADKAAAIEIAVAQVEEKFRQDAERIDKAIETISETVEVEVPDEEEQAEPTEVVEEQPVVEKLY